MSGEVLIDKAVTELAAYIEANLAAELRQVETDQGLVADSLGSWSGIVRAFNLYTHQGGDGQPEIQVYDLQADLPSQRHDLMAVQCAVDIIWTATSGDPEAAEDFGRRWATALYRCVANVANRHPQSSNSGVVFLVTGFDRATEAYESTMRHARSMGVEVRVHSPRS